MGILSQLVGQFTNFGLDYLNNYLVQKRLEDSMRQSTNYLTGVAIPEAKKATGFQEAMLEGQAPPGAASLLGFTSAPTVREPYGPQAQKLAESVGYNPQVPANVPMTPQLQETTMRIAEGVAGQPRKMVGEMAKAQEQKRKDFRQEVKDNLELLKSYAPEYGVSPEILITNARKAALTHNPADLVANLPGDFPQKVMATKMQLAQAQGLGAATGRGIFEGSPEGMGIFQRKAEITAATGAAYREPKEPKEPKEVSPHMGQDMMDELQRTNPEYFGKAVVIPGKGFVYPPTPQARAIVSKALSIYRKQGAGERDMYDALEQAKGATTGGGTAQPGPLKPKFKKYLKNP